MVKAQHVLGALAGVLVLRLLFKGPQRRKPTAQGTPQPEALNIATVHRAVSRTLRDLECYALANYGCKQVIWDQGHGIVVDGELRPSTHGRFYLPFINSDAFVDIELATHDNAVHCSLLTSAQPGAVWGVCVRNPEHCENMSDRFISLCNYVKELLRPDMTHGVIDFDVLHAAEAYACD